ncbi:MAG: F0F1 ATP synthase subunit A [Candidatus Staskawiczbacteria bacterium]|nr:F0F1 ATP synthase subunit A [Candidatus Staskawiczbacteria bacterium]
MEAISLKAQEIFSIGSVSITNGLLLAMLVSLILIIFAVIFRKKIKLVPGKVQSVVEMGVEALLNLMSSVLGSMEAAERYFPLIATIFIFILASNWLGLLPGVGSFVLRHGSESAPFLRSPAADLNFTLALAVMSVLVTNFFGIVVLGTFTHLKKFLNFSNPLNFFVGILEFLSEISRIISFSFRLFGNIFAGEVLLSIMFFLLPYIVPVPFMMLEIFFGMIQAFIFAMLTLVFLSSSITSHEEHAEPATH